ANFFFVGIKEGQRDFALRFLFQVVMDNDAIGGILPGIEIAIDFFARGYLLLAVCHDEGTCMAIILARYSRMTVACKRYKAREWAWREQIHIGIAYLITQLV